MDRLSTENHGIAYRKTFFTGDEFGRSGYDIGTSPIVCPVSGRPYVYKAAGRSLPGRQGRLVLYDPEPSHSGMRWGILVRTPASGGLMTANVILVSESDLASARKRP